MNGDATLTMAAFRAGMDRSEIRRQMIPANLGMGYPVLSVNDQTLLVKAFFYRVLPQENDQTQLFPPTYEMTALWPSGKIVSCRGLRYEEGDAARFEQPIGRFRHDAIRTWPRERYERARESLFAQYDLLIAYLLEQSVAFEPDPMIQGVSTLFEPSLVPAYRSLDASFMSTFYRDNNSRKEVMQ